MRAWAVVLLFCVTAPIHAQDDASRDLARAQTAERKVLSELSDLERELLGVEPEIAELQLRADQLEQQRIHHSDELAVAQGTLDQVTDQVARRIRALHRVNKRGFARIVFSIENPADLRKTAQYLTAVLRADQSHSKKFIEQVGIKAAALKRVESDRAALAALQAELRLQEASLRDTQARRMALLEDIRTQRDLAEAVLRQRRQAQEALTQRFSPETAGSSIGSTGGSAAEAPRDSGTTSSRSGFRSQAGKLPWPTSGTLMRRFGKSVDPRTGAAEKNAGIDIRAAFGTPFRAVADGVVQHNGYVPAFGMVVILQHGSYSSVYAHAGKTQVARGQSVRKGDVLGFVGETGVTDGEGPRLHFEIRYHQTPQDPMSWLAPGSRR